MKLSKISNLQHPSDLSSLNQKSRKQTLWRRCVIRNRGYILLYNLLLKIIIIKIKDQYEKFAKHLIEIKKNSF